MVELLLDAGASVKAVAMGGWTPLHSAAATGRHDAVMVLLRAGASTEARDGKGRTAHNLATQNGHAALLREGALNPLNASRLPRGYGGRLIGTW